MSPNHVMSKINNIRKELSNVPLYQPQNKNVAKLEEIENLSVKETLEIMNQLATKTCELDCIPTKLMKEYASVTGPLINTVINKSLEQGEFP